MKYFVPFIWRLIVVLNVYAFVLLLATPLLILITLWNFNPIQNWKWFKREMIDEPFMIQDSFEYYGKCLLYERGMANEEPKRWRYNSPIDYLFGRKTYISE